MSSEAGLSSRTTAALLLAASAAILAGAFAFQYLGGLAPCILCWWQRYAHMAAIVLAALALAASRRGSTAPGWLLVAATGIALLAGTGIAAFHVGVEQHWWAGTAECGSQVGGAGGIDELRARLLAQPIVRCDEIAWSLFGISMAGYNFLLSLALAGFAVAVGARHLFSQA
ncbi:MAG: disulfide bond formation protein B [Alphaproteobacteria bacterium]|nr:disulfide bond formation protein B [Alphaproteobacteria bacterium]